MRLFDANAPTPRLKSLSVAAVALDAELRAASEPDWGMSPRTEKLLWLGAGALVVVGLVALLVWRASRGRLLPFRR